MTAKQNAMMGNVTNDEVARVMENKRLGRLVDGSQISVGWDSHLVLEELANVANKLDAVNRSIQDKEELKIEMGAITQTAMRIIETRKKGHTKTVSTFNVK